MGNNPMQRARAIVFYMDRGKIAAAKYRNVDARDERVSIFEKAMCAKFMQIDHINYYDSSGKFKKQSRP